MDARAFVPLGRVAKTHGLDGEVSVITTEGLPVERLCGLEVWFVPPPATVRSSRVLGIRPGPKGPLFSFEGVSDLNTASSLRGTLVLARASELPEVEEELDVVGFTVTDETRGDLGEIVDVILTGANDVWIVHGPYGEVLVPVIDDVVTGFDEDERHASVKLLPGLIEGE
jgi:16S rRNA processing protein RimM